LATPFAARPSALRKRAPGGYNGGQQKFWERGRGRAASGDENHDHKQRTFFMKKPP
jgi:hypothetical protein